MIGGAHILRSLFFVTALCLPGLYWSYFRIYPSSRGPWALSGFPFSCRPCLSKASSALRYVYELSLSSLPSILLLYHRSIRSYLRQQSLEILLDILSIGPLPR